MLVEEFFGYEPKSTISTTLCNLINHSFSKIIAEHMDELKEIEE